MATLKKVSIQEVNQMDYGNFISHFDSILEHGKVAAATVWEDAPFRSIQAIVDAFMAFMHSLSPEAQRGILRCCPDLTRKPPKGVSETSIRERQAAGMEELTELEAAEVDSLVAAYRRKFGFPFIMCARKNKKDGILRGIRARLQNSQQEEMQNAFAELAMIIDIRVKEVIYDRVKSRL